MELGSRKTDFNTRASSKLNFLIVTLVFLFCFVSFFGSGIVC